MTAPQERFSDGELVHSRYRIVSRIGAGGVATVYRATDEQLGRDVALKVIPHGATGSAERARIEDEVRLLAGFNHPALVTLYDVVPDDGLSTTLVMQLVEGDDLSARGALASDTVARIGAAVAGALAFVHEAGVIHRDVKPANILLPASGPQPALLADFGIARLVDSAALTSTGTIIGTASYLSPEQARGETLTTATDVYSLGLVLLEALTGVRAFPGTSVETVVARLSADPVIPAELGDSWTTLLASMLDREPAARPPAQQVEANLDAIEAPGSTKVLPVATAAAAATAATERLLPATAPTPTPTPAARTRRTVPKAAVIAIVAVLAIATVAAAIALNTRQSDTASAPAETTPTVVETSSAPSAPPPITYPAVEGDLGERLTALQSAVAELDDDELAHELGLRVLAVTEAAATEDYELARTRLDELTAAIDSAALSSAEREAITEASREVREELDEVIRDSDGPGKGNDDDKPGKKP